MDFKDKVTEISKKAGKVATETYNTVADKSGKLFEEAKARMSISDMEKEIDKMYESMGVTVYDNYKKGEDVGKFFTKECKKIDKYHIHHFHPTLKRCNVLPKLWRKTKTCKDKRCKKSW